MPRRTRQDITTRQDCPQESTQRYRKISAKNYTESKQCTGSLLIIILQFLPSLQSFYLSLIFPWAFSISSTASYTIAATIAATSCIQNFTPSSPRTSMIIVISIEEQ